MRIRSMLASGVLASAAAAQTPPPLAPSAPATLPPATGLLYRVDLPFHAPQPVALVPCVPASPVGGAFGVLCQEAGPQTGWKAKDDMACRSVVSAIAPAGVPFTRFAMTWTPPMPAAAPCPAPQLATDVVMLKPCDATPAGTCPRGVVLDVSDLVAPRRVVQPVRVQHFGTPYAVAGPQKAGTTVAVAPPMMPAAALGSYGMPVAAPVQPPAPAQPAMMPRVSMVSRAPTPAPAMPVVQAASYAVAPPVHPANDDEEKNFDALCRVITSTVAPTTWKANGGTGTLVRSAAGHLEAANAPDVLADVRDLLASLRKLQAKRERQVSVRVCVVEVSEECADGLCTAYPQLKKGGTLFCKPAEATEAMRALTENPNARTITTPTMAVYSGEPGCVSVSQQHTYLHSVTLTANGDTLHPTPNYMAVNTGVAFSVTPTVSADGKFVMLKAQYEHAAVTPDAAPRPPVMLPGVDGELVQLGMPAVNTQTIEGTWAVPAGGTAVVLGAILCESRCVTETCLDPTGVVARVPYLNRLVRFRSVAPTRVRQVLFVTPMTADEKPEPVAAERELTAVERLVRDYKRAAAAGETDVALRLAVAALALDPTCLAK